MIIEMLEYDRAHSKWLLALTPEVDVFGWK